MRRRSCAWPLVAVAVVSLGLAACSSANAAPASSPSAVTPSPSTSATPAATATVTARSVACAGLATINQKLAPVVTANAETTVGEVKAVQQKVAKTLNAIQSRIPPSDRNLLGQIRSANDQLAAKIAGYPDSTPIGQTSAKVQNIKTSAASAQAKAVLLATALKCPPLGTPTPKP